MTTGSLQVKKGRFYMVLNLKDANGKSKPKWMPTGLTEKGNRRKADQMLRDKLAEYDKDDTGLADTMLYCDFIEQFWLPYAKQKVRENTFETYWSNANKHVIPYFRKLGVTLRELLPIHIEQYYMDKLAEGQSRKSVVKHNIAIRGSLILAVKKMRLLAYNPADGADLPPNEGDPFTGSVYSPEQIEQLLAAVAGHWLEYPVLLAAYYGLRRSEVLGLKWDAIDFEARTISIRHTAIRISGETRYQDKTKTNSSKRVLPLMVQAEEPLKRLYAHQQQMKKEFGNCYDDNDYICKYDDGKPFEPNNTSRRFSALLEQSELPKIRFHDLRHSTASLLHCLGYSLKQIAEWMGHGDIKSTVIYTHVAGEQLENMAQKMGEALQGKAGSKRA